MHIPVNTSYFSAYRTSSSVKCLPQTPVRFGYKRVDHSTIPVIDLQAFKTGSPDARMAIAKAFGEALQTTGFVALKHHGIPKRLIDTHFANTAHHMKQPRHMLECFDFQKSGRHVGYFPPKRTPKNGVLPDPKHAWMTMSEMFLPIQKSTHYQGFGFLGSASQLFRALSRVGGDVSDIFGLFLSQGAKPGVFEAFAKPAQKNSLRWHMMRSIHYPTLSDTERPYIKTVTWDNQPHWVRTDEHLDLGLFTLLPQAAVQGLQLLKLNDDGVWTDIALPKDAAHAQWLPNNQPKSMIDTLKSSGQWLPVETDEDYLILNCGATMELLTKGLTDAEGKSLELKATLHRVVGDRAMIDRDRYSVAFFYNGNLKRPIPDLKTGAPLRIENYLGQGPVTFDSAFRMMYEYFKHCKTLPKGTQLDDYLDHMALLPQNTQREHARCSWHAANLATLPKGPADLNRIPASTA